tara:strand:+ start:599 stop:799 length:201 start_codon:yes stop_codon:yes gene_type:complete
MKITKDHLKQIIKEEIDKIMEAIDLETWDVARLKSSLARLKNDNDPKNADLIKSIEAELESREEKI